MGQLDGKVAIISGGARGQGEAEVRRFVAEGAKVVFGDVLDDLGKALASELGDAAYFVHHDVTQESQWDAVVATAESRFGKVDVLVNNAGILAFGGLTWETSLDDYMRVINVNQIGVFLGMKATIPAMLRNRGGSIVNISSTNGLAGFGGTIAYTASKFAVRGMTKNAALELGRCNIRVNSVHPGGIDTPMTRPEALGDYAGDAEFDPDANYQGYAMGRAGQAHEVANLVLFLASDQSSYCTGAEFVVDGGMLAGQINPFALPTLD
jgi:3alpha(or 20beta)-hydroxysteroid dehydrogenase